MVHDVEMIELLCTLYPKDKKELVSDACDLDDFIYEKLEIGSDSFRKILELSLPLASRWKSPLTDTVYAGFVDEKKGFALMKVEVPK